MTPAASPAPSPEPTAAEREASVEVDTTATRAEWVKADRDHDVHRLAREVDRLRDLLRTYGGHQRGCRYEAVLSGWGPCSCGWDAIAEELGL